jgi:hypothetical protein
MGLCVCTVLHTAGTEGDPPTGSARTTRVCINPCPVFHSPAQEAMWIEVWLQEMVGVWTRLLYTGADVGADAFPVVEVGLDLPAGCNFFPLHSISSPIPSQCGFHAHAFVVFRDVHESLGSLTASSFTAWSERVGECPFEVLAESVGSSIAQSARALYFQGVPERLGQRE